MKRIARVILPVIVAGLGCVGGFVAANIIRDGERFEAAVDNYSDRGNICLEAAALIRNNQQDEALRFLETQAHNAVQGVPMLRSYNELPGKSQKLVTSAKRYDNAFPEVDWNIDRLTKGEIPLEHIWMSSALREITGG